MSSVSSCCAKFLEDPMSGLKVLVPTLAFEVIMHKKVWQKTSLRDLTLYLALVNTYWFATTMNLSFLETPLFVQTPHLNSQQKEDCGRQRFNWLNKMEIAVGVIGLDIFCVWREKLIDNNGFVDNCLSGAVLVPAAVTAIQAVYLLPTLNKKAKKIDATQQEDASFPKAHLAYVGFEAAKLTGLAVAGLRFGKMLTR